MPSIIGAHLNGSVNLPDTETVLRTVGQLAGATLRRIPDGETGPRQAWVRAMLPKLRATPQLIETARDSTDDLGASRELPPLFALRDGASGADIAFPDLGYASAALESYATFAALRDSGELRSGIRFQVSLPTPFAVSGFIAPDDVAAVMPAFEGKLRTEVDVIASAIPPRDLAIQWDVAPEFAAIEGIFRVATEDPLAACVSDLVRLAEDIPEDVELGYHLCYGDVPDPTRGEGRHFLEPRDTSALVAVANMLSVGVKRPIQWFSIPVPIARDDDEYFRPLAELELHPETELYIGLIHHQDGIAGARRRIAAASRYVDRFGVATECGLGRKPSHLVPKILEIHRDVCLG